MPNVAGIERKHGERLYYPMRPAYPVAGEQVVDNKPGEVIGLVYQQYINLLAVVFVYVLLVLAMPEVKVAARLGAMPMLPIIPALPHSPKYLVGLVHCRPRPIQLRICPPKKTDLASRKRYRT